MYLIHVSDPSVQLPNILRCNQRNSKKQNGLQKNFKTNDIKYVISYA
jgi:hypothetical protein